MRCELVQTTTRDDIRLDGAFLTPASSATACPFDGFVLIHGTGGNFYSSTLFDDLAQRLLDLGSSVLRVNTRGHDGISTAVTSKGGRRQGAAFEVVDDCRHDIAAWLAWLKQRTGPRVGLLGHSLGAVKCIYAAAHEPQLAPACIVAISPPRLSYSWFCASSKRAEFLETYQRAEKLAGAGSPAALMEVALPLPFIITAAGYLEKYGPDERCNFLKFIGGVPCPVLVTLGEIEMAGNMAFQGSYEILQEIGGKVPRIQVKNIAGADHFYTGVRSELIDCLEEWFTARQAP